MAAGNQHVYAGGQTSILERPYYGRPKFFYRDSDAFRAWIGQAPGAQRLCGNIFEFSPRLQSERKLLNCAEKIKNSSGSFGRRFARVEIAGVGLGKRSQQRSLAEVPPYREGHES